MSVPYQHVVLFRLHPGTSDDAATQALELLRGLGARPGVRSWRVERSIDDRKGTVLVEIGSFEDEDAFRAFRDSAEHRAAGERMAAISDWLVGDYFGET